MIIYTKVMEIQKFKSYLWRMTLLSNVSDLEQV